MRREYRTGQLKERWNRIPAGIDADVVTVPDRLQLDLAAVAEQYEVDRYDRVVIDLKWRFLRHQARALAAIPNLVIHEFDAFWNFMRDAPCYLDFERVYHRLPPFRLICCGATVRDRFRAQGLHSQAVPKAFDARVIRDFERERDIPVAFIGSLDAPVYRRRRELLEAIRAGTSLQLLRTSSADEYVRTLNRVRVFVSADAGMSEYTAKNFEAMAAGCVLVAYRQGGGEEEWLGLEDMKNVLLYDDAMEATQKIRSLLATPLVADEIARAGRLLARERFSAAERDRRLFAAVEPEMPRARRDLRPVGRQFAARFLPSLRGCG